MKQQIKTIAEALIIIKELQTICNRKRRQIENLTKEVESLKAFNQFFGGQKGQNIFGKNNKGGNK